jgi:hypothetical protein
MPVGTLIKELDTADLVNSYPRDHDRTFSAITRLNSHHRIGEVANAAVLLLRRLGHVDVALAGLAGDDDAFVVDRARPRPPDRLVCTSVWQSGSRSPAAPFA